MVSGIGSPSIAANENPRARSPRAGLKSRRSEMKRKTAKLADLLKLRSPIVAWFHDSVLTPKEKSYRANATAMAKPYICPTSALQGQKTQ